MGEWTRRLIRSQAENNKVKILNFIHKEVHHATERKVPALVACSKSPKYETEIYHRSTFGGSEFDVCIVWDAHIEGEQKVRSIRAAPDHRRCLQTS